VGFRLTGRRCIKRQCNGKLRDNILDWEDPLPQSKLEMSEIITSESVGSATLVQDYMAMHRTW